MGYERKISYSSIGTYKQCSFRFKLSKIDGLKTIFDCDPKNPLVVGRMFHRAMETDNQTAIKEYFDQYPIIDDLHLNEVLKIECLTDEARSLLPAEGLHEVQIETDDYLGFIDLLVPVTDNTFDLYDFKYSAPKNWRTYLDSAQLHVYKHYFELANPGKQIRNMYYLFAPKTSIYQKKKETLEEFRRRLSDTLASLKCEVMQVEYDPAKVEQFHRDAEELRAAEEYPKTTNEKLCGWCEFEDYCKEGCDYMLLPENKREAKPETRRKKIYLYGAPFSGKSYLANEFPDVLFISTDGNYTALPGGVPPHIDIKDRVTVEGRLTKRVYAWEIFKEVLAELEKKENTFKTLVIDLTEDLYQLCRHCMFAKLGIQHESDSGYGKGWDIVQNEFLTHIKKFMMLDYDYLILISHEDISKDITKRSGDRITAIKPNIPDKLATKIAGMTDIVIRVVNNNGRHEMQIKPDEYTFGGGRLINGSNVGNMPASYENILTIYETEN